MWTVHWAAEAINRANDDGAMVGTGTFPETGLARFEPDADLTSAQFAVIVAGEFYRDIPDGVAGPWYAPFRQAMDNDGSEDASVQFRPAKAEIPLPAGEARQENQQTDGLRNSCCNRRALCSHLERKNQQPVAKNIAYRCNNDYHAHQSGRIVIAAIVLQSG